MQRADRFVSLDGLRGIAAMAVMFWHAAPGSMPGGFLAVDFFFCLSGFVIALAFGHRLGNDLNVEGFLRLRAARLYPMMFLGGLLGIALHGGNPNILLLVPDFHGNGLYPSNPPFWSLLAEVVANVVFALILVRMPSRYLAALVVLSGIVLMAGMLAGPWPRPFGSTWDTAHWLVPRTLYPFALGILMYRWRGVGVERRVTRWAFVMPVGMVVIMAVDSDLRVYWDIAARLVLMPAIVWIGTRWEMPGTAVWRELGALSYPLYCIHMPVIYVVSDDPQVRLWVALALIPVALALDHLYDRRVRGWLAKRAKRAIARQAGEMQRA